MKFIGSSSAPALKLKKDGTTVQEIISQSCYNAGSDFRIEKFMVWGQMMPVSACEIRYLQTVSPDQREIDVYSLLNALRKFQYRKHVLR